MVIGVKRLITKLLLVTALFFVVPYFNTITYASDTYTDKKGTVYHTANVPLDGVEYFLNVTQEGLEKRDYNMAKFNLTNADKILRELIYDNFDESHKKRLDGLNKRYKVLEKGVIDLSSELGLEHRRAFLNKTLDEAEIALNETESFLKKKDYNNSKYKLTKADTDLKQIEYEKLTKDKKDKFNSLNSRLASLTNDVIKLNHEVATGHKEEKKENINATEKQGEIKSSIDTVSKPEENNTENVKSNNVGTEEKPLVENESLAREEKAKLDTAKNVHLATNNKNSNNILYIIFTVVAIITLLSGVILFKKLRRK